jgi:hypothetical protein
MIFEIRTRVFISVLLFTTCMNRMEVTGLAREYMEDFARTTGLDPPSQRPKRYLWTDAFAVCTYLGLFRQTGDSACRERAIRLIDQVHHTLGRYREDDPREGWISRLPLKEGELHPTAGGLRIGKSLPERGAGESYDEQKEWDRDGQYFHYLTQWMHALSQATRVTNNPVYHAWAVELARTAHARFTYRAGGRTRMYWKMSTDLSRPLVASMGQHDPFDGLVTYTELHLSAGKSAGQQHVLQQEITDMAGIVRDMPLATEDPLGIGGLLSGITRVVQLTIRRAPVFPDILESVSAAALVGLESFTKTRCIDLPARYRLAFRELGLSIGLAGIERLPSWIKENPELFVGKETFICQVHTLQDYVPLKKSIETFWLAEENRASATWTGHKEINTVMLATSLVPEGFLEI